MPVFATWEVWGKARGGSNSRFALFPYNERENADKLAARVPGGYVLAARIDAASKPHPETFIVQTETPKPASKPQPAPVAVPVQTVFRVWDDVNDRYVTTDGLRESAPATFATRADATEYATRLNVFGNYGGWASLRFHVR